MTTFAHIETGQVLDPQVNNTPQDYLARYSSAVTIGWNVVKVPDGTTHNASINGDGTYTNPVSLMASKPTWLTQIDFITLCQTAGGMTDAQLVTCRGDATFAAMWIKFNAAAAINRDDARVQAGLAGLEQVGYINKGGAAAVIAAWPMQ